MPLIRFYRHAKSVKNQDPNIVGGRSITSPVTQPGGRKQADELGLTLRREGRNFVAAFTSNALRARQTGGWSLHAAGICMPLQPHEGLLEISQGIWEGRDRRKPFELPNGVTELYSHPYSRGLDGKVTGGESVREVGQRLEQTLLEIAEPFADQKAEIAVFSHDFALRCLRVRLEDDLSHIRSSVNYCSETTIGAQEGQLTIIEFGAPMISTK